MQIVLSVANYSARSEQNYTEDATMHEKLLNKLNTCCYIANDKKSTITWYMYSGLRYTSTDMPATRWFM